jgi:hypothetical protein
VPSIYRTVCKNNDSLFLLLLILLAQKELRACNLGVTLLSTLLGLSGRPVSCLLHPWCWCPWLLLSNGPRRRWWSLACLDRLEWIHRHHGGPQSGSKIVIALMYNRHLDMPGLEVLKSQFIYVDTATTTLNWSSHFSIPETFGSETWKNSCTTCVWIGSSASCEYSRECS